MSVREKLFFKLISQIVRKPSSHKITICGAGNVGTSCAISLLSKRITNEIALVDVASYVQGEAMDFQHGSIFLKNAQIHASQDFSITKDSKICILTPGYRQRPGETRLDLLNQNTEILKSVIPRLVKHSPDTILLLITNPVDIMTHIAWKLSGFPSSRVLGVGTTLDSARFRYLIAQRLNVAPSSVHGWIVGEHGDSSVPVWSGVSVGGVRLAELNPNVGNECGEDKENWCQVHQEVIESAYEIIELKGYTNWAVALSAASICEAILNDENSIHAVSTCVQGQYEIDKDVFLSLPCVLNADGVRDVVRMNLTFEEKQKLIASADVIYGFQKDLKLKVC